MKEGKQTSKQKQCDQRARFSSPQQSTEDRARKAEQQSRPYINVGVTRFAVLPLQARVLVHVDAGTPGAVPARITLALTPLMLESR